MPNIQKQHIFFVDDEPKVRELVGKSLEQAGFKVRCFSNAVDCLKKLRSDKCDLVITDVKLPKMSGIDLLTKIKCLVPSLPVVLITGFGDIPMAVNAMRAGAADFIEKPLNRETLLSVVKFALQPITPPDDPIFNKGLTHAEMKVFRLILEGKTNKETSNLLHRSIGTIEAHRKHIMRKLGVDNVVDLVRRATSMGLLETPKDK